MLSTADISVNIQVTYVPDIPSLSIIFLLYNPLKYLRLPMSTFIGLYYFNTNHITELIPCLDVHKRLENGSSSINMRELHIPHPHTV